MAKIKMLSFASFLAVSIFLLGACTQQKPENIDGVPQQPIHWHPKLKIIIKGEEQFIPPGIGISTGKNIDNQISGMRMAPTHTHESDGTIHLENNRPWLKPETLTLGYFFEVWGKNFNSSCIFEYCINENGSLTLTVNGQQNFEYENYVLKDNDLVVIRYDNP